MTPAEATIDALEPGCTGFPSLSSRAVIPTEACMLAWQQSLALLALLVEAEVPA